MTRYAITAGTGATARQLAAQATRWASEGIDLIQLREPALAAGELYTAARSMLEAIHAAQATPHTRLLINSRADVALAARAHGVHLTSRPGELTPPQVRTLYELAGLPRPTVSRSAHTLDDVRRARDHQADLILFGPVFEKRVHGQLVVQGVGLDRLREACAEAGAVPVLALGGLTLEDASACCAAGAPGLAGIRLYAAMLGETLPD